MGEIRACYVFLEEVPHVIELHDNRLSTRARLDIMLCGRAADPLQYRARSYAEHPAQRIHRDLVAVEKHGQRLLPQRAPPWRGARELIPTASTEPALGAADLLHVRKQGPSRPGERC